MQPLNVEYVGQNQDKKSLASKTPDVRGPIAANTSVTEVGVGTLGAQHVQQYNWIHFI